MSYVVWAACFHPRTLAKVIYCKKNSVSTFIVDNIFISRNRFTKEKNRKRTPKKTTAKTSYLITVDYWCLGYIRCPKVWERTNACEISEDGKNNFSPLQGWHQALHTEILNRRTLYRCVAHFKGLEKQTFLH